MVVDDSTLVRQMIRELIEQDEEVKVIAEAENGAIAVDKCQLHKPDVILMDIQMPVMDGIEAVKRIMEVCPTPIIVLSATVHTGEVRSAFRALRAGALDALPKPQGLVVPETFAKVADDLLSRIKLYALVGKRKGWAQGTEQPKIGIASPSVSSKIVVIGASTGGPGAIMSILTSLPANFPSPIILVQHMSEGFLGGFAQWLDREVSLNVVFVEEAVKLAPGNVYVPTNGYHIEVSRGAAVLREGVAVNSVRPAVDVLFKSVAREYREQVVGVLLTGMGRDGAEGALEIKEAGGTMIVQDEDSSVVFGMPKSAIELGAADFVEPLNAIPSRLAEAVAGETPGKQVEAGALEATSRILVVDDSPTMLAMVSDILVGHGFIVQQAENGRMALEEVSRQRPDMVLLDVMMPELDGYEVCQMLRKDPEYLPILMVTAKGEPHDLVKGLSAGADDYISKPFEEVELIARVKSLLRIRTLQQSLYGKNEELESKNRELKSLAGALDRANKELTLLSVTDGLTRAYNHRHFQERVRIEFSRAERYHTLLSCVLLDLDHFKKVNDTYGHPVGDMVLIRIVEILTESVRDEDLVARYGGEEFVLLLPETGGGRALTLAQRIRERVEQEEILLEDGSKLKFTVSLGVSHYEPGGEKVRSSDQLIGLADKALYKAKENGRNRAELL
jgi:two-component system chemotaxis response regulator CheB